MEGTRVDRRPPQTAPPAKGFRRALLLVERVTKETVWDCRMCGQCILHSTGLSCPMRCPKNLRNGPCGGTLQDGSCEVLPEMKCVWVAAWEGAQQMAGGTAILAVQKPVDHSRKGTSSWLRVVREKTAASAEPAR
jgi:Methylene-tetrahydrofolate reductase C terminal